MTIQFDDVKQNKRAVELRHKEEEDLAKILSEKYGVPYLDLSGITIDTDGLRLIPEEESRKAKLAIFDMTGKRLRVAVLSPRKEETNYLVNDLEKRGYVVEPYVVSNQGLQKAWERYKDISFAEKSKSGSLAISGEDIEKYSAEISNTDEAKTAIQEVLNMEKSFKTSKIVEVILASAISIGASDVHMEPADEGARIRFRLDGVLTDIADLDSETFRLLLSRVKLLSGMKLNIKREPQDGRFSIELTKTQIEIRASAIPGAENESIVLRLLDPESIQTNLQDLGIEPYLLEIFEKEIAKPDGLILNTGPTGSGKTTTLYAFMRKKYTPEIKIITIEDPIEYHLEGIVQTQVDKKKNYDFATGLKSSLRQDPDVIMVGEIREFDTAETAIQAAMTGHLVFSTLHTNTAAGAFTRLIDLGVNPKVLTSSVNIAIAQRLVRKLCPDCKKEITLEPKREKVMKDIFESTPHPTETWTGQFYAKGEGCPTCDGRGYKGRVALFEAVKSDDKIEEVLQMNPSEKEVSRAARHQEIWDMAQDGVIKAMRGVTSLEEVERVVNLEKRETRKTVPDKENNFKELTNEDLLKD